MSERRISQLMITIGTMLVVVPPLLRDDLQEILPVLLIALLLIIIGIARIVRMRFLRRQGATAETVKVKSHKEHASESDPMATQQASVSQEQSAPARPVSPSDTSSHPSGSSYLTPLVQHPPFRSSVAASGHQQSITSHTESSSANPTIEPPSVSDTKAMLQTANPSTGDASATETTIETPSLPETNSHGLFDIDPEELHAQIIARMQLSLLELFDIDPAPIKAAIATLVEQELLLLFDIDPESLKAAIAELMEQRLLELFDIDPIVVHQALATRSEEQLAQLFDAEPEVLKATIVAMVEMRLAEIFDIDPAEVKALLAAKRESWEAELFDVDPAEVKKALATMLEEVLFDIDPAEVKKALAAFGEEELLDLFEIDPEMVKAALKLRYASELLELFDGDPQALRATFAWRQEDSLAELFDVDPEVLKAMWEAQKAEPLHAEAAIKAHEALVGYGTQQIIEMVTSQQELMESLSQLSLGALQRRKSERERRRREEPETSGKVSLEYLRRQVAVRIVEERIISLEIHRLALSGVITEQRLNEAQKALLLGEISRRLTAARTQALQLQQDAREQLVKQRLADQEANFRATRRPQGALDEAARERMRQRMLNTRK